MRELLVGNAYLVLKDNDKAIAFYQQSLALPREIKDRDLESRTI
jgi:hypothetical protein